MSAKNTVDDFEKKLVRITESGCWIWVGGLNSNGYGIFSYNGKQLKAYRFSFELHNGPIINGLYVCHRCDVPACVNPNHLFLGTNKDNTLDSVKKGRHKNPCFTGEDHHNAKLTKDDVIAIRASNETLIVLGDRYGVAFQTISKIKRNKAWKY